ncbi:hypothetical protein Q4517_11500 [Tenacibaculum sp. 1_MG-2023]|uniref:hypothetical protein n=1 Tax=Tenacibaculum sp. 1_MG-2023 TaxID=3062653 RepID=UPI0026E445A0|nr:hypothetical protein [Tenacibaculum sp. 1_MG-2023]MDO6676170.1 hypothetical protein [Tenacibaculum sp. 1_MG-2023]
MKIINLLLSICFVSCMSQQKLTKEEYLNVITVSLINNFDTNFLNTIIQEQKTSTSFNKINSTIDKSLKELESLEDIKNDFGLKHKSIQILLSFKKFVKESQLLISKIEQQNNESMSDVNTDSINTEINKLGESFSESKILIDDFLEMMNKYEDFNQKVLKFCKFHKVKIPDYVRN